MLVLALVLCDHERPFAAGLQVNRRDFQALAQLRIREAKLLLDGRMPSGAYYLTGYAVECALKACIAKQTRRHDFPLEPNKAREIYVHDLNKLLSAAGLASELSTEMQANSNLRASWAVLQVWSERSRYERHTMATARAIYGAAADPANGVFTWLRLRW